jgi:hypothetical protein
MMCEFNADFFQPHSQMIHYLGQARTPLELHAELAVFQDANRNQRTCLRSALRIRVSGRKVATRAHQVDAGKASLA